LQTEDEVKPLISLPGLQPPYTTTEADATAAARYSAFPENATAYTSPPFVLKVRVIVHPDVSNTRTYASLQEIARYDACGDQAIAVALSRPSRFQDIMGDEGQVPGNAPDVPTVSTCVKQRKSC
jgi:hypothetical protein